MSRHWPRLRRLVLIAIVVLVVLWGALWGGASLLAPGLIRRVIPTIEKQTQESGIGLAEVSFTGARLSPWFTGIALEGLHARFDLQPNDDSPLPSVLEVDRVEVRLENPFTLRGSVRADGAEVQLGARDLPGSMPFDRFENGSLSVLDLPLTKPIDAAKELRNGIRQLFNQNELAREVQFSGDVVLKVEDVEVAAYLYTQRIDDKVRLRFRTTDVESLAKKMELELSPEQVEIVSLYPLRVPLLIEITDQARDLSQQHEPDDKWLRDAHRHVTWSYLLTEEFGPDFAKLVTDAHETALGNKPNERAMDFQNNAMGRTLYSAGVTLESLPLRVREDPDIIRHPEQISHAESP